MHSATDTPTYKLGSATAKRVIMIFAAGGLSQLDLFDEKPLLNKRRGEELPDSVRKGQRITGVTEKQGALPVVGSCFKFKPYGKSGLRISELFREMGAFADDICLVRSMQTDHVLHEAAMSILFTGTMQLGRPSWGSWVTYALGHREQGPPGVRRDALGKARRRLSAAPAHVAQRLPAGTLPGLPVPQRKRAGFLRVEPRRSRRQDAAADPRHRQGTRTSARPPRPAIRK